MILRLLLSLLLLLALATPSWARMAFGSGGALATGTTSVAAPFPATILAGDVLIATVINKYPTNAPTLPTDAFGGVWVAPSNNQASGGFGADTTDLGHVYTTVFYKVATGTETGNLTISIGSGNSAAARILLARGSTGTWSIATAQKAVDLSATAWSAATGVDIGITTGDLILVASGGYTDATTFSAHALTNTGVNFGTVAESTDTAVTDGEDMRYVLANATVTSGPSSAADLTYTATASGLTGGSTVIIRIRESASTPVAYGTIGTVSTGTTPITPAYPASLSAGDLLVLCVLSKYPPNGTSTPTDWTAVTNGQATGGIDPDGASTGHVYATVFTKVATGAESGTLSVSTPSANVSTAYILRYTNSTGTWLAAATNGGDNVIDASWSVTGAADQGVASGDMVFTCTATANLNPTFTETTELVTQTGVTYGLSTELIDTGVGTGDDIGAHLVNFVATAGTSSAAPVYTATLGVATSAGATAFLRIRQDVAAGAALQPGQGFMGAILP